MSFRDEDLSQEKFVSLCSFLVKRFNEEEREHKYAKAKEILALVGKGILIAGIIFAPGIGRTIKFRAENEYPDYKLHNDKYLKRTLRRLEKQKDIEIKDKKDEQVVELTEKGKRRILKYALEEMRLSKPKVWDGKWRMVIYDISRKKDYSRKIVRDALKRLGFFQLQESVYLSPYKCHDEIEFLRDYYGLTDSVSLLTISDIENDEVYRDYFGIKVS